MELVRTVLDLPVIVQGALGSGLFWAVHLIGQRVLKRISHLRAESDKKRQDASLMALGSLFEEELAKRQLLFQAIVHGTLSNIVSGLVFLVMGLIIDSLIPVFGFIGYFGALLYFFRALSFVPDYSRWDPAIKKIEYEKEREKRRPK